MRVRDAVTDAPNIRFGFIGLVLLYVALFTFTVLVLRRLARVPLPDFEDIA
jgi:cytochrome bd-type quinol oxidase subunit 1